MTPLGLNLRDLNLAIPYAVQSGVRYLLTCAAGLWEPTLCGQLSERASRSSTPGVLGSAAPSFGAIPCAQT